MWWPSITRSSVSAGPAVQQASRDIAVRLAGEIEATGAFRLISKGDQVPAFAIATLLLEDLRRLLPELRAQPAPVSAPRTGFHH